MLQSKFLKLHTPQNYHPKVSQESGKKEILFLLGFL
jgi:hypothetical protein